MSLVNATPYPALAFPFVDATGREQVAVIVKLAYLVGDAGRLVVADEAPQLRAADELYRPDDPTSSARYPADVSPPKVGTCVVVVGDAVSARPVTALDVAVRVRQTTVPLRVHGERIFYRGVGGIAVGPALAFERKPIVYERAYGGTADNHSVMEPRNPSGVGVARRPADLVDRPAPQIEHPARPHKSASDRHPPVGFGAILPFWSPRREHAGTLDEAWQKDRMPLPPADFDPRYHTVAHPSLAFDPGLVAGDPIGVIGMSLDALVFELPPVPVRIAARSDVTGRRVVRPPIDTVLIEPGARRVEIVVRAAFPVGRGRDVLRELVVDGDDG